MAFNFIYYPINEHEEIPIQDIIKDISRQIYLEYILVSLMDHQHFYQF